jgi:hypothetical protein
MNLTRLVILVFSIAAGAALVQLRAPSKPPAVPKVIEVPPDAPYHGVAIQVHSAAHVENVFIPAIDEIADLGADTVAFSTAVYQEHAGAQDLGILPERTARPEQWAAMFSAARRRGLRIVLMPIVLLDRPRGTEWRGQIKYAGKDQWDTWFKKYRELILGYAALAAGADVEVLMVGSELVSTEDFTERWRDLIRDVRKIYPGKLGYSANWDHYRNIAFWNDLDLIGMTSYHQLADKPGPTLEQLIDAWKPIRKNILDWQATVGKPILFTEVGWASQEGCAVEAWNYYRQDQATAAGREEQRRCYEAFCLTWGQVESVGGAIWWEWTEPRGDDDISYTPKSKPAQTVLRRWFGDRAKVRAEKLAEQRNVKPAAVSVDNEAP